MCRPLMTVETRRFTGLLRGVSWLMCALHPVSRLPSFGRGVLNCVLILLEAGARVDEKNNAGATPLHRAANNGHVRDTHFASRTNDRVSWVSWLLCQVNIVSALIKEGANVNEQDEAGNTPLASLFPGYCWPYRCFFTVNRWLVYCSMRQLPRALTQS